MAANTCGHRLPPLRSSIFAPRMRIVAGGLIPPLSLTMRSRTRPHNALTHTRGAKSPPTRVPTRRGTPDTPGGWALAPPRCPNPRQNQQGTHLAGLQLLQRRPSPAPHAAVAAGAAAARGARPRALPAGGGARLGRRGQRAAGREVLQVAEHRPARRDAEAVRGRGRRGRRRRGDRWRRRGRRGGGDGGLGCGRCGGWGGGLGGRGGRWGGRGRGRWLGGQRGQHLPYRVRACVQHAAVIIFHRGLLDAGTTTVEPRNGEANHRAHLGRATGGRRRRARCWWARPSRRPLRPLPRQPACRWGPTARAPRRVGWRRPTW